MGPLRCLTLLAILNASIFSVAQKAPGSTADFLAEKNVAVAMRDGVILRADVMRPKSAGPFPVLVYRTPYGKENALKDYTTFTHAVERGYAVVIQDVRGRYDSAGEFIPYQQEGKDGYDTIEWAAKQPWSNGSIGTFGLSYPGAVQWLAAVENPPHLKAMVPAMTFSSAQNFFYAGGTWDMSWIEWIWDNIAPDARVKRNVPGPKTEKEAEAAWRQDGPKMLRELPLSALAELKGLAPYYYEWLKHPYDDAWWDWCDLRNKYDRVHAAVLNFSGWYDDNYGPEGATTNFTGLLKSRTAQPDPQTHLLVGPWVHGVDSTAKTKSGERMFAPSAAINYDEVVLHWLDHYVRGVSNGVEKEKPVRYYVMGANQWRAASSWPPPAKATSYYLDVPASPARRSTGLNELTTQAPKSGRAFGVFISKTEDPVLNRYNSSGAHDYRDLSKRQDVMTFDSVPLARDLEVTGPIEADMFIACDCRDMDLWVRLLDVAPDGTSFNLMNPGLDVLRASYRDVKKGRQLLNPGQIYELNLTNLITSNVFRKGHRLRVQVSASFFPNFSRNLQTGELEQVSAKTRKANIRIYHDKAHPSRLILPVVQEQASTGTKGH
jgi:putative CocE/NonD family hydrolase